MPTPITTTVGELLKESPVLNKAAIEKHFPKKSEQEKLAELSKALDQAIKDNQDAEATWESINTAKSVVIKLANIALGKL
jgi:hypothetical protein